MTYFAIIMSSLCQLLMPRAVLMDCRNLLNRGPDRELKQIQVATGCTQQGQATLAPSRDMNAGKNISNLQARLTFQVRAAEGMTQELQEVQAEFEAAVFAYILPQEAARAPVRQMAML
jgi:hypothetical protein